MSVNPSVEAFVEASLCDLRGAEQMLAGHPEIGAADLHAALVIGDVEHVSQRLNEAPALVNEPGGPRHWAPLLYVCFSQFANHKSRHASRLVETARALLARGADPNASYIPEEWPDNPLSCLYAATGLHNNPALALALIEAGARLDDSESLYHSTEHEDLACFKLLLQHGASLKGTNVLKHMLDREDVEGLRLLFEAGADPNEVDKRGQTALHWAVWRVRSPAAIAMLLDHGAAIDARRSDGRTAYSMAAHGGQAEVAELLAARGAGTELSELDRFMAACATANPEQLNGLLAGAPKTAVSPENNLLLTDLAATHRTTAVRALLATGVPVDLPDTSGATALHWACWKGYADLVKLLLEQGASTTIEEGQYHATPPGWFGHGLQNCGEPGGDYPEVARLLLAARATIPAWNVPTGNAEVDRILREYGVI